MADHVPIFGEGVVAQPPYQPETIYSRISTMRLEEIQYEMRQMKRWIRKASDMLEQHSLRIPDDDGYQMFILAKDGKDLLKKT